MRHYFHKFADRKGLNTLSCIDYKQLYESQMKKCSSITAINSANTQRKQINKKKSLITVGKDHDL